MLLLLAEADKDQALAGGYLMLFWIALAGLIGVFILLGLILIRRYTKHNLEVIERDQAQRREMRSTGRVDAWREGAERYIDHDKLPDDVPYDTESDADETDEQASDEKEDEDRPPPGWNEPGPEQDPYGLFDDKPYREPEEDDEDEDEDDGDWDDADDEQGR